MKIPHLDAVGVLHVPDGYERTAPVPRRIRFFAAVVLVAFVTVVVGTTAASLGQYCLTTDTTNTAALDRLRAPPVPPATATHRSAPTPTR